MKEANNDTKIDKNGDTIKTNTSDSNKSFSDNITTTLKEAEFDLDKGQAKIVIIEEGWSSNNFYYSRDRLIEMKDLLEDRRKMYANHESSLPNLGSRNIFEWACTIKEVFLEGNKLKAIIDFTDNPYTNWLKNEAKKHPEEIQFSINAEGFTHAGEVNGREGNIVDKMSIINSVDLVSYGAAGGRLEDIRESINKLKEEEWDREYINNLPDGAFAVLEPAYVAGETDDKRARHLPHHTQSAVGYSTESGRVRDDSDASIDLPHLRNALARVEQIEPFTDSISTADLREIAREHLRKHEDLLEESVTLDSLYNEVKEVENLFSALIKEQRENDTKEVDIMKLSELKTEYSDLMEEYRNEIESELKEELNKSKKLTEKDEEIESLKEEIEGLKESKDELKKDKDKLSEEVNKYQMKEKANKRKSFVRDLLKESNLNISLDNMPKDFKESVLNLDRDEEEVKKSIEDLIDFVSNDNLVEDAGETTPSENNDNDEEVDLTEDDKKALEALIG